MIRELDADDQNMAKKREKRKMGAFIGAARTEKGSLPHCTMANLGFRVRLGGFIQARLQVSWAL
eukprot:CAMPEP_0195634432 /NCGR_PEP_ID=MMETSP0815-20121206/22696_1 /TAXON_ID=97485 /ORGANISM="Prymnesium parvum, Strain Texoma1" /LENGTH=63 /DNA_ID=CAMNT_0040776201 /DNA_START=278 /DNA_END=465 /DNA_ORIENTATION=-